MRSKLNSWVALLNLQQSDPLFKEMSMQLNATSKSVTYFWSDLVCANDMKHFSLSNKFSIAPLFMLYRNMKFKERSEKKWKQIEGHVPLTAQAGVSLIIVRYAKIVLMSRWEAAGRICRGQEIRRHIDSMFHRQYFINTADAPQWLDEALICFNECMIQRLEW